MHFAGCPRIVRADRGTENSRIAYLQPFLRRNGTDALAGSNSFQYGRSASNQVRFLFIYVWSYVLTYEVRGISY